LISLLLSFLESRLEMDVREIGYRSVDLIVVAQRWAFLSMLMDLQVPQSARKYRPTDRVVGCSRVAAHWSLLVYYP
jgi:hypothetical protein